MFTQITVVGNLGNAPELRVTQSGQSVCNFSLAVNRYWNDASGQRQEQVTWWRIAVWGKMAEACNTYLAKGSKVLVAGDQVQARPWTDNAGEARASLELTARNVQFLSSRSDNGSNDQSGYQPDDTEINKEIPF